MISNQKIDTKLAEILGGDRRSGILKNLSLIRIQVTEHRIPDPDPPHWLSHNSHPANKSLRMIIFLPNH
jgi:hypothetical protein